MPDRTAPICGAPASVPLIVNAVWLVWIWADGLLGYLYAEKGFSQTLKRGKAYSRIVVNLRDHLPSVSS